MVGRLLESGGHGGFGLAAAVLAGGFMLFGAIAWRRAIVAFVK